MGNTVFTILAIDDDPTQLELLRSFSEKISFPTMEFFSAETAKEGLELIAHNTIDLVLTDYRLPDSSGIEVLIEIKKFNPLISVVVMTAYDNTNDAVNILKQGGDDYLIKPTKLKDIEHLIIRIFEKKSIERENRKIDEEINSSFENIPIIYKSESMRKVLNLTARTSESTATVLITGESGTGKELIARLVHQISPRREKPFVTVNIAALPETLIESELFGHIKGSFTGADQDRVGRFEEADGGTLFIDEIGDVPLQIQVKLLRVIQFGQIQRIGENLTRNIDVRIITATSRDIERMISENTFRNDLYWRLNVINIALPALRQRKDDIPILVKHFIEKYNNKNNRNVKDISREALDSMMRYQFPGNIRELENMIERAVILCRGDQLTTGDIPVSIANPEIAEDCLESISDESYEIQLKRFEQRLIEAALEKANGNQSEAARLLSISERRLRSRLGILGITNRWT